VNEIKRKGGLRTWFSGRVQEALGSIPQKVEERRGRREEGREKKGKIEKIRKNRGEGKKENQNKNK
jgi:hypothetical protein